MAQRVVRPPVIRFILERLVYADASLVDREDVLQYWSATQLPGYGYATRASLGEFDWSPISDDDAARLAVPTLVMLGAGDRLVRNTESAARRLRQAVVRTIAGGHAVQEENPDAAYPAIAGFLSER
jgi:pimeloyl-ACP methyl ester carboxylesterase